MTKDCIIVEDPDSSNMGVTTKTASEAGLVVKIVENGHCAKGAGKRGRGKPRGGSVSVAVKPVRGRGRGRGRGVGRGKKFVEIGSKRGRGRATRSSETVSAILEDELEPELEAELEPDLEPELAAVDADPVLEEFEAETCLEKTKDTDSLEMVSDNLLEDSDLTLVEATKKYGLRAIRVLGESASSGSGTSSPSSRTSSPRSRGRGRGRGSARKQPLNGHANGVGKKSLRCRKPQAQVEDVEDEQQSALVKQLSQQITNGDYSSLEGSPMMSPKVLMKNFVVDLNTLEETKAEIKKRLDSFEHITENHFMCARRINKQSKGMECDCTISKEDYEKGIKGCGDDCLNRLLFIECSKICSLGNLCGNKRFQNVENAPVEVFKTAYKGLGLRATAEILPETFIMEYVGEVLDYNKFRKRAKKYSKDDAQHFYFMALSSELFIDASHRGNISRFINHSCNPNAETQKWTVNGELRVGFFCKRKLAKGEELTFDYKYERYGQEAQKCYCGAENCRGWLGGDPKRGQKGDDDEEEEDEEDEEEEEESSETSSESSESEPETVTEPEAVVVPEFSPPPKIKLISPVKPASPLKKIRRRKMRRSPRKIKNFDADDYEEELEKLKSTGIRTKLHTRDLCRRMIQTTDLNTKLILSQLLKRADPPCRRLFIDYRGLYILGNWVCDLSSVTEAEIDLIEAVEDSLLVLSIPDKQVLMETKLWQTFTRLASDSNGEAIVEALKADEKVKNVEDEDNQVLALEKKKEVIKEKAKAILESWAHLQEVKFKIPKNDRALQRAQHEREVEAAEAERRPEAESDGQKIETLYSSKPWSYYDSRSWNSIGPSMRPDSRPDSPPIMAIKANRKRPRPSRFDDETGELHNPRIDRNALRHLFSKKAQQEYLEKVQRDNMLELHKHKCKYLCLDPSITPLFPQFPEYYYNPEFGQWFKLPPFEHNLALPSFHPRNYPRMANMPVEAFQDNDEPLPDPSKIYPPGVVPISYFFGPPMSLDPRFSEMQEAKKAEQENMPITYIDPETGYELPIPELSPEEFEALDKKRQPPTKAPSLEDLDEDNEDDSDDIFSFLNRDDKAVEEDISNLLNFTDIPIPAPEIGVVAPKGMAMMAVNGGSSTVKSAEVVIKLPPNWKVAKDSEGRLYFYNKLTREVSWDPPEASEDEDGVEVVSENVLEIETITSASEAEDENEEDGEESDDEEEDDSDKEDEVTNGKKIEAAAIVPADVANSEVVVSDLSEQEKELLLGNSRRKTKEERQHERRQKRERDREKREYEKKRRRERHGKHRRDGLVQEYFIPRRTEKEKADLMTFDEMRARLANRDAIREKQEAEERAEEEREIEEASRLRREQREAERRRILELQLQHEQEQQQQLQEQQQQQLQQPVAAAADTSSEVARKIKERFLKETSKVVVKVLDPYRRDDAASAKIRNVDDFKHLAKKLTNYIMTKELKHCPRIEDLKCNERVKKKTSEFVRKYMSKFGEEYKRSPSNSSSGLK